MDIYIIHECNETSVNDLKVNMHGLLSVYFNTCFAALNKMDIVEFSCIIYNMNKFLFGQCTTAPCKQVKNTCKTKLNYLNLKAEIPMSDDARHILKFQHII